MLDKKQIAVYLDTFSLFSKYGFSDGDIINNLVEELIGINDAQNRGKYKKYRHYYNFYEQGPEMIDYFLSKNPDMDPDIREFLTIFQEDIDLTEDLLIHLIHKYLLRQINPKIVVSTFSSNHNPVRAVREEDRERIEPVEIKLPFETVLRELRVIAKKKK